MSLVNNTSVNVTSTLDLKDELSVKTLIFAAYAVICGCSLVGNSLVVFVVASNTLMQTVTNLFICNLAVSDLTQTVSSLWLTPAYIYQGDWVFGTFFCYWSGLVNGAGIFISTFTLSAIAVDRYIFILHPFRPRMELKTCVIIITCIWVFACLLMLPLLLHVRHVGSQGLYTCTEDWSDREDFRVVYGYIILAFQFGIPFVVNTACYSRIVLFLRQSRGSLHKARSAARQRAEVKKKQRLNQMLILMVVMFGCSWLPLNVLNVTRDHSDGRLDSANWFMLAFLLAHICAMSSTMWNPILYAWKNEIFKKEFMAVLPCFPGIQRVKRANAPETLLLAPSAYDIVQCNTLPVSERNKFRIPRLNSVDVGFTKVGAQRCAAERKCVDSDPEDCVDNGASHRINCDTES